MNAHTPGPWKVGEASWTDSGYVRYELEGITLLTAADARLIAAAPDLLEALERIANSVAIGAESKQLHARMRAIFKEIEKEARAAIEKATK